MPAWFRALWDTPTATATNGWDWASSATTQTATTTGSVWWSNAADSTSTWVTNSQSATVGTGGLYTQGSLTQQLYQQQQLAHQAQAYSNAQSDYYFALSALPRLRHLGQAFVPSRPAIITHQDEARRDRELYRLAMQEHDEQEIARLRRIVERHEQTEAEQRLQLEQRLQQARENEQRREAAKARARELLFEHLSPQQRETFDRNGWFVVEGGRSKTQYRIRAVEHMAGNVDVLTVANRVAHRLCAHVQLGTVPLGDQLLAQKVMLELAEDDFLRIANRHAA